MAIITISRGSYSKGKAIAEKLAARLGYKCLARGIIVEAAKEFNIPEVKLVKALHNSPSILDRFTYGREKYNAYIKRAFLHQMKDDNVVYHGLAGHFFLKDVPGVLKVRIIADMESRIREEMKRENSSRKEAEILLRKDDEERRKWSQHLYGIDTTDAGLYDLVIHIDKITEDQAVDLIEEVAKYPAFQITPENKKAIDDLYIAAQVQAALIDQFPTVRVNCSKGKTYVCCKGAPGKAVDKNSRIDELLNGIQGLDKVNVNVEPIIQPD